MEGCVEVFVKLVLMLYFIFDEAKLAVESSGVE